MIDETGIFHGVVHPEYEESSRELHSDSNLLDIAKLFSTDVVFPELVILCELKVKILDFLWRAMPSKAQVLVIDSPVHDIPICHDKIKACKEILVQGLIS